MRAGWGGRAKKEPGRDAYEEGGMTLRVGSGGRAKKEHWRDAFEEGGMIR